MKEHKVRNTLIDVLIGGLIGGLVGAVVAVNFVLIIGAEEGYESSLAEVFEHSTIAGVVTLVILIAGPIAGFLAARRRRALSDSAQETGAPEDRVAH